MLQEIIQLLEDLDLEDGLGVKISLFASYVYNVREDQLRAL